MNASPDASNRLASAALGLTVVLLAAWCCLPAAADDAPANLALGRKVVFSPPPNYELTARGGTDANDLTDGKVSSRKDSRTWFDSGSVAWSYAGLGQLAVDLGRPRNVASVTMRWQGGSPQAGICVPCWVDILASDDGQAYYRVGSFSRWRDGDERRFKVPPDEGKPWVHELVFPGLDVTARYIGVELYGAALSVSDEMRVAEAPRPGRRPSEGEPSAFTVAGPRLYFHKPVLFVPTNVNAPTPIGWIVPPGREKLEVTATLDLPKGVRFVGGSFGETDLAAARPEPIEDGAYDRYTLTFFAGKGDKAWRRVYLRADWPDGRTGALRYQLRWKDGGSPVVAQPLRAIAMPAAPQPKRLMTGLGWWPLRDSLAWPDSIAAWRHLGLNTLPLFGRWAGLDDPNVVVAVGRFREAGFKVMNIDSTFHQMIASAGPRKGELVCQLPGDKVGQTLCPSYRGELYEAELNRLARQCVQCKADYLSCDIELWGWRGPIDAERCTRCRADFNASGLTDWRAWRLAKGERMWVDVATRVRTACAKAHLPPPELGVYDFRPGRSYQDFWPFDRLYPRHMSNSQVSTYTPLYPYHLGLIGDEARTDRDKLPRSDVLPWITPGDAGTFPAEAFTAALLECFANGSRGVHFWSGRLWDAETLAGYARAIRIAAAVEDVIVDGRLISGVTCRPEVRVSGMRRGEEMFLLVADYHRRAAGVVEVKLPPGPAATVVDLDTGKVVAKLTATGRSFALPLEGKPARALHVRPGLAGSGGG